MKGALPEPIPSSFRDPAGFVFRQEGVIKRLVMEYGRLDHQLFLSSGLEERLVRQGLIVEHRSEAVPGTKRDGIFSILVPRQIPFISYPYEWSFDELKDAALLTLQVQEEALACGMSLKDATAFNVQFVGAKPIFIDLLSFEPDDGGPWVAYEQFCRHFLGPLLLMHHRDATANRFLRTDLDGFPIGLVSRLLPWRTWLSPDTLVNVHLHARSLVRDRGTAKGGAGSKKAGLKKNLLASLRSAVEGLRAPRAQGVWADYSTHRPHYTDDALDMKQRLVGDVLHSRQPKLVFDLGANNGIYSQLAAHTGCYCVAFDSDAGCVNHHYLSAKARASEVVLPLVMNFENPSPSAGFHLEERSSLADRGPADLALVLALVHHLRLTVRVPFVRIASFLAGLANSALIEFVPLSDPMAQLLLRGRTGGMEDYTLTGFLEAFERYFVLSHQADLPGTSRSLWLASRKPSPERA